MLSYDYWAKRMDDLDKGFSAGDRAYLSSLKNQYELATREIKEMVTQLYAKYGTSGKVSFDAVASASDRGRLTRLQALQKDLTQTVNRMTTKFSQSLKGKLKDAYVEGASTSAYTMATASGIGTSFTQIPEKQLERAISRSLNDKAGNYSQQVWDNRDNLVQVLSTTITQGIAQGKSITDLTKDIQDRMNSNEYAAERIARTETMFARNQGTADTFKEAGVRRYTYIATLDERTCPICGALDGQEFNLDDKAVGVNYPPLHPNCRCTTVAVVLPSSGDAERIAKDKGKKYFYVPSNTSYNEWKDIVSGKKSAPTYSELMKSANPVTKSALPLFKTAIETRDKVTRDLHKTLRGTGATLDDSNAVKPLPSLENKIAQIVKDNDIDTSAAKGEVTDALHYTVTVEDSDKTVEKLRESLADKGYTISDVKDDAKPDDTLVAGKRVDVILRKESLPVEIRVQTPEEAEVNAQTQKARILALNDADDKDKATSVKATINARLRNAK